VIVVPWSEYACALLYFTGSAHFNRSIRNLAARCNMSLNEHALSAGVVRTVRGQLHRESKKQDTKLLAITSRKGAITCQHID